MKRKRLLVLAALAACGVAALVVVIVLRRPAAAPRQLVHVRQAAVAGFFYPADPKTLSEAVDAFLAGAAAPSIENVRGLICPHAGYDYSGRTAAMAYKLLAGRDVRTVFVLASSHYADFAGAMLTRADAYATPLGVVEVSPKAASLEKAAGFVLDGPWLVHRPDWWRQSPQALPAFGQDTPETWEHSVEVQLPFLQKVLKDFAIVPVIYGRADPAGLADAIEGRLDDKTVVVASSDLSHYHPYSTAVALDDRCLNAICTLNVEAMAGQEACGKGPILTLMHLARRKGWRAWLLHYTNSGGITGDYRRVVGYGAVAFYQPGAPAEQRYSSEERRLLLGLARSTLRQVAAGGEIPQAQESALPARLKEPKGCFVTLTKDGSPRGCMGHLTPQMPLYKSVMENAKSAAVHDERFGPLRAEDLDQIEVEISVLSEPQPLYYSSPRELIERLQPHADGVILKIGDRAATFLPQVWRQIPDKEAFLGSLAEKAGCPRDAWRLRPAAVFTYRVEAFKESEP